MFGIITGLTGQIKELEAKNERLTKQRKRILGQGVIVEMEKKRLNSEKIQRSLDKQLKKVEALLGQVSVFNRLL